MSRFDNKTCPICKKALNDKSDVVVCPECGTPHHRACYLSQGRCGVEEFHKDGFVWNGCLPWEHSNTSPEAAGNADSSGNIREDFAEEQEIDGNVDNINIEEFLNDIHKKTFDDSRGEDGVSTKELSCFVGRSVMHYAQAFTLFRAPAAPGQKKRRMFFNPCAGLFLPFHQFYRRMDAIGLGLTLLQVIFILPQLMYRTGMLNLNQLGGIQLAVNVLSVAVMIAMSFFGDYFYYRFVVGRIKKIREKYDDGKAEGYYEALAAKGNPSWLRVWIAILAIYFAIACIGLFTQPDFVLYTM